MGWALLGLVQGTILSRKSGPQWIAGLSLLASLMSRLKRPKSAYRLDVGVVRPLLEQSNGVGGNHCRFQKV
jgi:hypothetical protein